MLAKLPGSMHEALGGSRKGRFTVRAVGRVFPQLLPDTLLNVFLAIAVDNLANAQELTKVGGTSLCSTAWGHPEVSLQPCSPPCTAHRHLEVYSSSACFISGCSEYFLFIPQWALLISFFLFPRAEEKQLTVFLADWKLRQEQIQALWCCFCTSGDQFALQRGLFPFRFLNFRLQGIFCF